MSKPIRVALSGSGFLLPAHVGALQAVADAGFKPVELAGTSGGSIVAVLAATEMPLDVMKQIALTLDWSPMMSMSIMNIARMRALSSGTALLDFLTKVTHGLEFDKMDVELKVMASNIGTKQPFIFSKATTPDTPVALAARASAAIPVIYEPVFMGDAILFDGGMVNNMPSDILIRDDVPRIGVDLVSDQSIMLPEDYSLLAAAPRFIDMLLASSEDAHIADGRESGVHIIPVQTGFASSLDRTMCLATRERLFNIGYATTLEALKAV